MKSLHFKVISFDTKISIKNKCFPLFCKTEKIKFLNNSYPLIFNSLTEISK